MPRPNHEVGLARNRYTLGGAQITLRLNTVALGSQLQHVAGLAVHDVLHQLDGWQSQCAPHSAQAFNESTLQHRIKIRIDVDVGNGGHFFKLVQRGHQLGQHFLATVPRHQVHVAAKPVLVHTPVATIFFRIVVAGAFVDGLQCHAQHICQRSRVLRQQLVQIPGAARNRVVQHDEVPAWTAVFTGFILRDQAKVIHPAAKSLFESELQYRHERLHDFIVHARFGIGHQDAQGLRRKLAVQVQAVQQIRRILVAVLCAIEAVVLPYGFEAIFWGLLNFSAMLAKFEPWPG